MGLAEGGATHCSQSRQFVTLALLNNGPEATGTQGAPWKSVPPSTSQSLHSGDGALTSQQRLFWQGSHLLLCINLFGLGFWSGVLLLWVFFWLFLFFNDVSILHILAEGFPSKKLSGYSSDFHIALAFHVVPPGIFTN